MTVLEVKKIFEPGLHFVGGTRGLILNVGQRGSRSWILRFTASNGKRRDMGLGSYPDVGLKEAREEGDAILQKIRGGVDPLDERRTNTTLTSELSSTPTFEHCANQYIEDHRAGWANRKHEAQWRSTIDDAQRIFTRIRLTDGVGARCLELTILAAFRSGESRLAT